MFVVCLFWVCWCVTHSVLSDPYVTDFIQSRLPKFFRYYRLFYNAFSCLTLLPLILATHVTGGGVIFSWTGYTVIGRGLLLVLAVILFFAGARHYDLQEFLGTKQAKTGTAHTLISESGDITESGIFAITRHPWYLGSLLLVWSVLHEYNLMECFVASILSIYLVIGSLLEERKILAVYGERYHTYKQKVSMLFPFKWLCAKVKAL